MSCWIWSSVINRKLLGRKTSETTLWASWTGVRPPSDSLYWHVFVQVSSRWRAQQHFNSLCNKLQQQVQVSKLKQKTYLPAFALIKWRFISALSLLPLYIRDRRQETPSGLMFSNSFLCLLQRRGGQCLAFIMSARWPQTSQTLLWLRAELRGPLSQPPCSQNILFCLSS